MEETRGTSELRALQFDCDLTVTSPKIHQEMIWRRTRAAVLTRGLLACTGLVSPQGVVSPWKEGT